MTKVLAELNDCSVRDIKAVLAKHGAIEDKEKKPKRSAVKAKNQAEREEKNEEREEKCEDMSGKTGQEIEVREETPVEVLAVCYKRFKKLEKMIAELESERNVLENFVLREADKVKEVEV